MRDIIWWVGLAFLGIGIYLLMQSVDSVAGMTCAAVGCALTYLFKPKDPRDSNWLDWSD